MILDEKRKMALKRHQEALEELRKTKAEVEAREAIDPEYKAMRKKRIENALKFLPEHLDDE